MATFIDNAPERIVEAAQELLAKKLVEGTSGNISARMEDGHIACTPSSLDYRVMTAEDICIVNPEGDLVQGERGPTSEKYLHLAVMNAYEDIAVCIHSHAVHATMFAVAQQDIPSCIDEFTVYLGGDIRCTEYAPSGSPELAEQVVKALEDRGAALIANHGMVAVGTTMERAMHNTALVERSAHIIWGAKQLGTIYPLPEKVNQNFANVYPYMR
jgi:L-fuculose-phosphate aldolase